MEVENIYNIFLCYIDFFIWYVHLLQSSVHIFGYYAHLISILSIPDATFIYEKGAVGLKAIGIIYKNIINNDWFLMLSADILDE